MIAVDANILVYAHREDASMHQAALDCITRLAESPAAWCIPWPCVHEFLAIVTHPRIYRPPTPLADAIIQVERWLESPSLRLLGEPPDFWPVLKRTLTTGHVVGPVVHDGRIVALCIQHGVERLWSADRDMSRFAGLKTENPLPKATAK